MDVLYDLPEASLRAIAMSLKGGPLSVGLTAFALRPIVGAAASQVLTSLEMLASRGMGVSQTALLLETLAGLRARLNATESLFDIVLSGPDVPGIPTGDTGAVMQTLIAEARHSILLVGYAVHNGKRLFAPLAERMKASPELQVVLCLDIGRAYTDTSLASEIVTRFAAEFRKKHWPWVETPTILYNPRALADVGERRASLHAKCVIVDRKAALITSANFTEAAYERNIEAGMVVRHPPLVERLAGYFEGLRVSGQLVECSMSG